MTEEKDPRDELFGALTTATYLITLLLIVCGIPLVVLTWGLL